MKTLIALLAWCILLVLWPIAWLIALPFRLIGITFNALFAFLQALFLLPARALGWRPRQAHHPAVA